MNSTPTRVFNFDLPYTLFFSLLGISEILKPFKQNLIKMSNSMSNFLAVILASKKLFFFTILNHSHFQLDDNKVYLYHLNHEIHHHQQK